MVRPRPQKREGARVPVPNGVQERQCKDGVAQSTRPNNEESLSTDVAGHACERSRVRGRENVALKRVSTYARAMIQNTSHRYLRTLGAAGVTTCELMRDCPSRARSTWSVSLP
jgi:hypothetical protein